MAFSFNFIHDIFNMLLFLISNIHLVLLAILGLSVLVVIHEFGHFIFAKLFNVYVPSFSIGFGPALFKKKIGETTFYFSAIPLGGYVEMAGSPEVGQGEQKHAHSVANNSFSQKPYWQKMLIMIAGIAFNLISAYIILTFLALTGIPCLGDWAQKEAPIIGHISKESPAEKSGLFNGDQIISINGEHIDTISQYDDKVKDLAGKKADFTIQRGAQTQNVEINIAVQEIQGKSMPKTGMYFYTKPLNLKDSLKKAWEISASTTKQIFSALGSLFKGKTQGLGGPVLLLFQISQMIKIGFKFLLLMLAFISINLAVFNLLPIAIFDGGQILFYTIEAIIGKPLSESLREKIHYYTFLAVIALVIIMTFKDLSFIFKLFKS